MLKKWCLWNITSISATSKIIVMSSTIFNDQLVYDCEGDVAKIWLVLDHVPNGAPATDFYILIRDWAIICVYGIGACLNGFVRMLWSLTYDTKSADNSYLSY